MECRISKVVSGAWGLISVTWKGKRLRKKRKGVSLRALDISHPRPYACLGTFSYLSLLWWHALSKPPVLPSTGNALMLFLLAISCHLGQATGSRDRGEVKSNLPDFCLEVAPSQLCSLQGLVMDEQVPCKGGGSGREKTCSLPFLC